MKRLLLLLCTVTLGISAAQAQNNAQRVPIFFSCKTPGGTYTVIASAMTAVSWHEYVVDGAARVAEVNIDTIGNSLVRYYVIEPIKLQSPLGIGQGTLNKLEELKDEAQSRLGLEEIARKVAKSYPTTTHAHTIEYRIDGRENLKKIFDAADRTFRTQAQMSVEIK